MARKTQKNPSGNICTRCGKQRIFKDSWQEKLVTGQGQSLVTYSQFVCPDPDCQKLMELDLAEKQQISRERQDNQDKRIQERNEARIRSAQEN